MFVWLVFLISSTYLCTKHSKEYSVGPNFYVLQDNVTSTLNTLTRLALQKGLNKLDMTSSVTINEVLPDSILRFGVFFGTNYFSVTSCKKFPVYIVRLCTHLSV